MVSSEAGRAEETAALTQLKQVEEGEWSIGSSQSRSEHTITPLLCLSLGAQSELSSDLTDHGQPVRDLLSEFDKEVFSFNCVPFFLVICLCHN